MRKPLWSLVMIACTVLFALLMLAWTPEKEIINARIVTVQRGDVHQVVAITGRIAYADETIAYARSSGVVSQVCVKQGERVGAGEALVRLDAAAQEDVLSAFVANTAYLETVQPIEFIEQQLSADSTVIRAEDACTVRQLLVQENALVTAGMPVARVSSNQQEILCTVASADVDKITPGMWAWLSVEGESVGFAEVISVSQAEVDLLTGLNAATVTLRPEQHIDLPEGATIDADVYLAGSDDVLTLPIEAVTERETVWWVSDGMCTEIPAEIVMTDEMLAWVALPEGLAVAVGEFEEGQIVEAAE